MLPLAALGAAAAVAAHPAKRAERLTDPPATPAKTPKTKTTTQQAVRIAEMFATPTGIRAGSPTGPRVALKGANWSGFQTPNACPDGLWSVSLESVLDTLAANRFNALRLPLSVEACLNLDGMKTKSINAGANPSLANSTVGQCLDAVVAQCRRRGILVLLDMHYLASTGSVAQYPLWYDDAYPEAKLIEAWTKVATRYKAEPTVFGADLKNEPHGATWGTNDVRTDWAAAAERIGAAVLRANPKLLIFVEGVVPVQPGGPPNNNGWWGGVVSWAAARPVRLPVANKVVYSPHVYGPGVHAQPYFTDPTFRNLPSYWDDHFGRLWREGKGCVCVGEWGGFADDSKFAGSGKAGDATWHAAIADYFAANGIDAFYWTTNPNSGDTGGILLDDFRTTNPAKLRFIATAHPNPTKLVA